MTDRELFTLLDASRLGAPCDDPALDAAARAALEGADARQLHGRIAAIDDRIAAALDTVLDRADVPAGLAERIVARLAAAAPSRAVQSAAAAGHHCELQPSSLALAAVARQANQHPNRRLFIAGGLAAIAAAVLVAIKLYPQPAAPWTADQVLDAAISFYGRDVDRGSQRALAEAPRDFPASRDLDRASVVAWRRPAEGFAESNVVAYDLASNAGGAAVRGVLYVFAPDRVADNLPDELPRAPSTPTTQGVCAAVWRDRDLVYVLVVEGGPREYRQFLRDRGGPVALRDSPRDSLGVRLAALQRLRNDGELRVVYADGDRQRADFTSRLGGPAMRIAYLDCASGISGDMMLGALCDAGVDLAAIQAGIDSLALPSCRLVATEVKRCGFRATHITVEHEPEHAHRHLHHITDKIDASILTDRQKDLAKRIFTRLGEAEAKVHGTTIRKVHFHEVGAVDSIADIVGSAIGWDLLGVDRIVASHVPTGGGFIEIAHGRVSVPAPATAELLAGIPIAPSQVQAELTTPTGAAILSTLVQSYGAVPAMAIDRIGYGAGTRDFKEQANLLRLVVGTVVAESALAGTAADGANGDAAAQAIDATVLTDRVILLETNLDDLSSEQLGYCLERLWQAGALDVTTAALGMKKNRPGVALAVMCSEDDADRLETILFRETTTLGLRRTVSIRHKLPRRSMSVETPWGIVQGVEADLPGGGKKFAPEYESVRELAQKSGAPIGDVLASARGVYAQRILVT